MESRERGNSTKDLIINSNVNFQENLQKVLFSVYKNQGKNFVNWLKHRNLSQGYIRDIGSVLESILPLDYNTPIELRDVILKSKNRKYKILALRNFFNFCEEYELLDNDLIFKLKSKIKVSEKSKIDSYVPNNLEIQRFLQNIKEYDYIGYIFVRVLLESGLRVSEVNYLIKNIELNNFEVYDDSVCYNMFYLRGNKNSYYLFISKNLFELIKENIHLLERFNVEKLKTWIKRNKEISLKYTRKYNFTKLIQSGVSFEIANFIQGRVSQNIGFNHYLAKKEVAVNEYRKLLKTKSK